jgi:hypothetical protein
MSSQNCIEQPELNFAERSPTTGTLNAMVFDILNGAQWWMPWELCAEIKKRHNVMVSDSSITARIRDLRKERFGSHVIERRKRQDSTAYEYRLVK